MNFRKKIKEICQTKGVTQKDLAEKLSISNISLNKTLRGEYPKLQSLEKIADALDVPISELFEHPDNTTITYLKCGAELEVKVKGQ